MYVCVYTIYIDVRNYEHAELITMLVVLRNISIINSAVNASKLLENLTRNFTLLLGLWKIIDLDRSVSIRGYFWLYRFKPVESILRILENHAFHTR